MYLLKTKKGMKQNQRMMKLRVGKKSLNFSKPLVRVIKHVMSKLVGFKLSPHLEKVLSTGITNYTVTMASVLFSSLCLTVFFGIKMVLI
jgi:hypothetical protein